MNEASSHTTDSAMQTRAVTAATIGTALEWSDFALYGALAATVLPKLFFPAMDATSALLASLATFGVGLAARPLGAVICGSLGDKFGRRNLMLATVSVMGLSSVLMGLLPTYAQIGVWAPILLVVLRIVQGFALGGESTGGQLMAIEHASPDRRGKYSGLLGICSPISQTNSEAVMVDWLQEAFEREAAVVLNPAGLSFFSVPVLDAARLIEKPLIEVHLTNIHKRDEPHRHSLISKTATGVIAGMGPQGYTLALQAVAQLLRP